MLSRINVRLSCSDLGETGMAMLALALQSDGPDGSRHARGSRVARVSTCLTVLLASLGIAEDAVAHPGPHHDIERLTSMIDRQPDAIGLRLERAMNYRWAGQYEESLVDCGHVRMLDPENRDVCLQRGLTFSAMKRDVEAERELSRFLEGGPGLFEAFAERGRIRERGGRHKLALSDYSAAIALERNVSLYLERGRLQELLEMWDAAAAGYRDGLVHRRGAVKILSALIRVEVARGRPEAALELIDQELGRSPIRTHWYLRRAEVFEASGQVKEARSERMRALKEANRLLRSRPNALNLYSRAQVNAALGRTADARRDLQSALAKLPRLTAARELLEELDKKEMSGGSRHCPEKKGA
jgi:tetratricopeptide (TPR) repeat protein